MKILIGLVFLIAFINPAFAGKGVHPKPNRFWDYCKNHDNGQKWHHWWDDEGHSYNPPPVIEPPAPVPTPVAKPSFNINGMVVPLAQCQATKSNAPHLALDAEYLPVLNTKVSARFYKGQLFNDKLGYFSRGPVSITLSKPLVFKISSGYMLRKNVVVPSGTYKYKTVKTGGYVRDYGNGKWKWSVGDAKVNGNITLRLYSYFDVKGVFVNSRLVVITNNVTPNKRGYVFKCK